MNINDPKERKSLSVHEYFKLPQAAEGTGSRAVKFTGSGSPIRIEGGRKQKTYSEKEQRHRLARKVRRERERIASVNSK